ncbi:MAG TPA: ADP/ATP-dependent (S)-NAD(P)H-hydrate dehydratase, partial [Nitrososphaera sp.]|nr:ADP/ATP-dependent (S)-NAD(P)H-hydrate dehydratase [Nitrososphaera sp.]
LPDDKLTVGSAGRLVAMLPKKCDSACVGMGMTIAKPEALLVLVKKLKGQGTQLLLDASALIPQVLSEIRGSDSVVTPHAGEFRRLFGVDPGTTEKERVASVARMAKEHEITILLKGPTDVVANPVQVGINRVHNSAMTVGGTGDVLSGIVATLMAKKMKPFDASLVGVYLNGLAGNIAFGKVGLHMVATDIIDSLAEAMKQFDVISK